MNIQKLGTTQSFASADILKRLSESFKEGQSLPSLGNNSSVEISAEGQEKLKTLKEIMSRYDVRNISYNDLLKLGRELYKNGIITAENEIQLTGPTYHVIVQSEADKTRQRYLDDMPRDYIALYEKVLAFEVNAAPENVARRSHTISLFRLLESLQPTEGEKGTGWFLPVSFHLAIILA